ncbi:MAG: hypothetical protein QXJ52_02635 [Candidatus Korarchaeota archaeon]|nr:hypothetical protein [Thermoproteota archaeon]
MRSLLMRKRLERLIKKVNESILSDLGTNPKIPLTIKLSIFRGPKFVFDRRNRKLIFIANRLKLLKEGNAEALLRYAILKVFAYRTFCPANEARALQIILSAINNSDVVTGLAAATILIELLADFYVSHISPEAVVRGLKLLKKSFSGLGILSKPVMHAYNLMLGEEIFHIADEKSREIGGRLYEIIFTKNITSPTSWPKIAGDLAAYIANFFKPIELAPITSQFTYDYLREFIPILAVQIDAGPFILERIIKMIYKAFEGDAVTAAPALFSTVAAIPSEILRFWYRERSRKLVKVIIGSQNISKRYEVDYPATWDVYDPIEKLDPYVSTSISPAMIPGYTTKKWERVETSPYIVRGIVPDILIVIDSSGSMSQIPGTSRESLKEQEALNKKLGIKYPIGSKFDIALVAAFGITECALSMGSSIGVVNFSNRGYVCPFTRNREKIEDTLMIHQNGGTHLPTEEILRVLKGRGRVLIIVLSDAAIYNKKEAEELLRRLSRRQTLYFLHIEAEGASGKMLDLESIKREGGFLVRIRSLEDLPRRALKIVAKHLEFHTEE